MEYQEQPSPEFKMCRMRPKFWFILTTLACLVFVCHQGFGEENNWLTSKYDVKKVISGDKFAIDFNGIQLIVSLVSLKILDESEAKLALQKWLEGHQVTIIPEADAGTTPEGFQRVYVFAFEDSKTRVFVNQKMIEENHAEYQQIKSGSYAKLQDAMSKAQQERLKESASSSSSLDKEVMDKGMFKVVSELYSKKYHRTDCRWANMIHPQSQIIYDTYQDAETAEKEPCSHCCYSRVQERRKQEALQKKLATVEKVEEKSLAPEASKNETSESKNINGLFGLKGDKFFYSPVSKKILAANASEVVKFSSLLEAKKSGRRPDPGSLRIENPVVPGPEGDECIGRSLPYLRPCRRSTDHPTGLCLPCLNAKSK